MAATCQRCEKAPPRLGSRCLGCAFADYHGKPANDDPKGFQAFKEEWEAIESVPPPDDPGQHATYPTLKDVHEVFRQGLHLPDAGVVDVTIAAAVANLADVDPVFLFVVAAASRGKTEALDALRDIPEAHALSSLTKATLFSGYLDPKRPGKDHSLLPQLTSRGVRFLVLKDFGTVLAMHRNDRGEVLAQLREVFDGSFVKGTGTGREIVWQGHMGFIAGVTPAIDEHHGVLSILGERFVYYRAPDVDRAAASRTALGSRGKDRAHREERRRVVTEFVAGIDPTRAPDPTPEATDEIVEVADFVARARTGVARDGYSREVVALPELEAPMRLAKQLASMWSALRLIGYEEPAALAMVERLALDSIPPVRRVCMEQLERVGRSKTADVAEALGLPTNTATRALEDLALLGVLVREKDSKAQGAPWWWETVISFPRKVVRDGEEGNISAGERGFLRVPPDVSGERNPGSVLPSRSPNTEDDGAPNLEELVGMFSSAADAYNFTREVLSLPDLPSLLALNAEQRAEVARRRKEVS